MDYTVMLATLATSILTAVIFGSLPAVRASGISPATVLKEEAVSVSGGLHKSRLSSALVIAQISLSLLLLICAGLFTRSWQKAQQSDPGFDPNHVLIASYGLSPAGYSNAQGIEFDRQLLAKLGALPGVESVTLADFSPLNFTLHTADVRPEAYVPKLNESMEIDRAVVGPNYLHTMKIPLVTGRDLTLQDTEKTLPVAIVNQAFVDRYWAHQDAMGKRVGVWGQSHTVVGVAQNGKYRLLTYNPEPAIFVPLYQDYAEPVIIHARVLGDPQTFAATVESTFHELNPDLPLFNVTTLTESMQMGSIFQRIGATFASSFGFLALVLAGIGIYGVVSYSTRQRTHEIGIRMALGAERGDVLRLVLRQGLRLTLVGIAVGLAVSLAVTRLLRGALFGVTPTDALTYASVALLLCAVALLASYIPARRATKVNPMAALRCE